MTCGFSTGEVISEKDRCKKCEGKKVVKEVKILEVHVDKGMKHGQKITFGGEADQAPSVEPGDIVLVLQEKDHEVGARPGQAALHCLICTAVLVLIIMTSLFLVVNAVCLIAINCICQKIYFPLAKSKPTQIVSGVLLEKQSLSCRWEENKFLSFWY